MSAEAQRGRWRAATKRYAVAHPHKVRARWARYRDENKEKISARRAAYYQRNKQKIKDKDALRRKESAEAVARIQRRWRAKNKHAINAHTARRKANQLQATPAWANQFFIDEIYDLAQRRTRVTGIEWEVDHVVPLKSPLVCGLHVEHNLRVIPAVVNQAKGNRHWPDMFEMRIT